MSAFVIRWRNARTGEGGIAWAHEGLRYTNAAIAEKAAAGFRARERDADVTYTVVAAPSEAELAARIAREVSAAAVDERAVRSVERVDPVAGAQLREQHRRINHGEAERGRA